MADQIKGSVSTRTAIGAGWMVAWRMATRVLGLASTLVLARILVPGDFGLVAMATTFSLAIDALSTLGLQEALVRHPESDSGLYDTAFSMQAVRGLGTALVICLGAWPASMWFGEPRLFPILLLLAGLAALTGLENIGIVEFRRALRFDMEFRLQIVPRIFQVVLTIGAAVTLRSYWALVIGIAVSKIARLAMTYIVHPFRPHYSLSRWRELVSFSFWTWASSMVGLAWERADPFILGPIVGPAALGVYMLSGEVAFMPISELVLPAAAALYAGFSAAQNRGTDTIGLAISIASTLLLMVVPLAIGVSATSGYIVAGLLGPKWETAQPLIAICTVLCAFSPFTYVTGSVLAARGRVRQTFFALTMAAAVKVAVVLVTISYTHRLDVIAATGVGCVAVESVCYGLQLRGAGDTRLRESLGGILRIVLAGLIAAGAIYETGYGWQTVTLPSGPALFYGVLLGCLSIAIFTATELVLWWLVGKPEGPESRVIDLGLQALRKIIRRPIVSDAI